MTSVVVSADGSTVRFYVGGDLRYEGPLVMSPSPAEEAHAPSRKKRKKRGMAGKRR